MKWPAFVVTAYLFMLLQLGLAPHIAFGDRWPVAPQFVLLLAVFAVLTGTPKAALVCSGLLGLALDLTSTYPLVHVDMADTAVEQSGATIVGPYTLGYMAGGYLVYQLRPMLLRQHPLTIATMMVVFGAAAHVVVLALLTVRMWYEPLQGFSATQQIGLRLLSLLYSAVLGVFMAYPLLYFGRTFAIAGKGRGKK